MIPIQKRMVDENIVTRNLDTIDLNTLAVHPDVYYLLLVVGFLAKWDVANMPILVKGFSLKEKQKHV